MQSRLHFTIFFSVYQENFSVKLLIIVLLDRKFPHIAVEDYEIIQKYAGYLCFNRFFL